MADIATAFVKIMPSAQGIKGALEKEMDGAGKAGGKSYGNGFWGSVAAGINKKMEPIRNAINEKTAKFMESKFGKTMTAAAAIAKTGTQAISAPFKMMTKGIATTTALAAPAILAVAKSAVSAYANYEQLVGGVETLFGTGGKNLEEYAASMGKAASEVSAEWEGYQAAQDAVLQNAARAYQTTGMSANAYMENVTSFAASLKQSFDGSAEGAQAAAAAADMAMQDIADNANKMGTPMERITDAYQGFAKQNYTMLDNLKLGYGGTKSEMERLLADAQALTGVEYNIDNLADVYSAIHVVQDSLGITGTTAEEAMSTISGSLNMTKAAWENLLTALAGGGDLDGAIGSLITSATTFAGNLLPVVNTILTGIVSALPQLVAAAVAFIPQLVTTLITLAPTLLTAGITLFTGLIQALPAIIPALIAALPGMITQVITALVSNIPVIMAAGVQLFIALAQALPTAIPEIVGAIIGAIPDMVAAVVGGIPDMLSAGGDLIAGLASGIWQGIQTLLGEVGAWCKSIIDKVKGVFGIASPSKVFAEFGRYLDEGLAIGIAGSASIVERAAGDLAERTNGGFAAAVNLRGGIGAPGGAVAPMRQNIINLNITAKELSKSDTDYLVETVNRRLGGFA